MKENDTAKRELFKLNYGNLTVDDLNYKLTGTVNNTNVVFVIK